MPTSVVAQLQPVFQEFLKNNAQSICVHVSVHKHTKKNKSTQINKSIISLLPVTNPLKRGLPSQALNAFRSA
jgi:hypothetical protein